MIYRGQQVCNSQKSFLITMANQVQISSEESKYSLENIRVLEIFPKLSGDQFPANATIMVNQGAFCFMYHCFAIRIPKFFRKRGKVCIFGMAFSQNSILKNCSPHISNFNCEVTPFHGHELTVIDCN